ncbi:hypothetical protein V2A60_007683 [Cordyceps javanica]
MANILERKQIIKPQGSDDGGTQPGPPIGRKTIKQPSQLACLPHELLVQIVYPILVRNQPCLLIPKSRFVKTKKSGRGRAWSPLVSILLACRAMYFAGVEVFYGRNTLDFVEALHLRRLVQERLSCDQRWSVTSVRLNVAWQRGRGSSSPWRLLHDCDSCAEWRDVLDRLPKLRRVTVRSTTDFKKADLLAQVDCTAFEAKMRDEIGLAYANLLAFEWPTGVFDTA